MTDGNAEAGAGTQETARKLSLRESIGLIVQERFLAYLTTTIFLVLAAVLEWLRAKYDLMPAPWIWTTVAAIAVVLCIAKYILLHRQSARRKQDGQA
jgi:hypothetical protein